MAAERTLSWGGEKFTITDDFLLLSAILFKDIQRSILGSPNIQYPRLLGAFGGSDDSGTRPRSHSSGWARPRWRRFLAQNVRPTDTVILPQLGWALHVQQVVWPLWSLAAFLTACRTFTSGPNGTASVFVSR